MQDEETPGERASKLVYISHGLIAFSWARFRLDRQYLEKTLQTIADSEALILRTDTLLAAAYECFGSMRQGRKA